MCHQFDIHTINLKLGAGVRWYPWGVFLKGVGREGVVYVEGVTIERLYLDVWGV